MEGGLALHPPNKKPTDAKIVKNLMKFEESWNVYLAAVKNGGYPHAGKMEESLYDALVVVRYLARDAQNRIDYKKGQES